jgi:hypothetical protein
VDDLAISKVKDENRGLSPVVSSLIVTRDILHLEPASYLLLILDQTLGCFFGDFLRVERA